MIRSHFMTIGRTIGITDSSYLGIYWVLRAPTGSLRLLAHACSLANAEEYGDCLTCPDAHIDVWSQWQCGKVPEKDLLYFIHDFEYEDWPRGRVVYDRPAKRFVAYIDPQLVRYPAMREAIIYRFGLSESCWIIRTDLHYRSRMRL